MNVVRKEEAYKETYTIDDIYALPEGENQAHHDNPCHLIQMDRK